MSVRRALLPSLLLSALLAQCVASPAAAAPPPQVAAGLERVADWMAGLQAAAPEARARGPAFEETMGVVDLVPLGDADGDGHDDLAILRTVIDVRGGRGQGEGRETGMEEVSVSSSATAVSGADLATAIWTLKPGKERSLHPALDGDGDGVRDFLLAGPGGGPEHSGQVLPVPFMWAGTSSFSHAENATLASGADLSALASLRSSFRWESTGAGAFPLVAGARAGQDSARMDAGVLLAPGRILDLGMASESTMASGGVLVAGAWGGTVDQDITAEAHAPGGGEAARVERDSDLVAVNLLPADVTADGAPDLVFLEARLPPANVVAGLHAPLPPPREASPRPVLAAHDGLTGAQLWSVEREPVNLDAWLLPSPGDLDGDGKADLAFFEAWGDTADVAGGPFVAPHVRTSVLSGADGSELSFTEATVDEGTLVFLLPFGDVDGQPGAEALRLDFGLLGDEGGTFTVSLVGLDLKPRWTFDAEATFPLNLQADPYTGLPTGFSDLDGDGAADLLLATFPEAKAEARAASDGSSKEVEAEGPRTMVTDLPLKLLGGRDGEPVWERTFAGLLDARTVPDVSGAGAGDLVAVRLDGLGPDGALASATLSYDIVRAETGTVVRSQVLRSPGHDPLPAAGMLHAQGGVLGDLDGDGTQDVGIHVVLAQEERAILSFNQTWLLFSGASGSALGAFHNAKSVDAPAQALHLAALPASDARPRESPTPSPAVAALAVLALAALLGRRRLPG